ncbi:MAG TPA: hypothetical protein VI837_01850, partial [Blastocatellia bacterium]|nr:hypothetical protein [Blastocatellia bacterium]
MRFTHSFVIAAIVLAGASISAHAHQDVKGSSDHPLFPNRMPGYSLSNYQQQGFSSYKFRTRPPQTVEGKYTRINYYLRDMTQHPGGLAIRRNYENAIKSVWIPLDWLLIALRERCMGESNYLHCSQND